jgi:hypothetical protein
MSKEIIKPEFLKCAVKVGTQYYKKSIFWTCVALVICAIAYGLVIVCKTLLPSVIATATSLPAWIYLVVGCLLSPGIAALVVCYVRQSKKEIYDADKDYVCPDE